MQNKNTNQFPFQPQSLVGNPVSDAYFGTLAVMSRGPAYKVICAHCSLALTGRTRMSNGNMAWCDQSHYVLWCDGQRREQRRLKLLEQGWTPERQLALNEVKRRTQKE